MTGARTTTLRSTALAWALLALTGLLAGCASSSAATPSKAEVAQTPFDEDLHVMLPEDLRAGGVLRVGTDASYAPASSFAQDGRTIVGFEPDLLAAVARVLGVDVELVPLPFAGLLDDVSSGRIHIAMSAMTDTSERQAEVDFVDYFSAGTSIVVRRGNPQGVLHLADLCGRTVAVERATVQVDLLARAQSRCGSSPVVVRELPDTAQALIELRTGRAVAVLSDYPPAAELANGVRTRAYFQLAADTQYEPGQYGAAISKDRPRLRDSVHGAFERLMASGEYERILRHWQVERGAVRRPTINVAAVRQVA